MYMMHIHRIICTMHIYIHMIVVIVIIAYPRHHHHHHHTPHSGGRGETRTFASPALACPRCCLAQ